MEVCFNIKANKIQDLKKAFKTVYTQPKIPNPNYVPGSAVEGEREEKINEFNDGQWIKESVKIYLRQTLRRYRKMEERRLSTIGEEDVVE